MSIMVSTVTRMDIVDREAMEVIGEYENAKAQPLGIILCKSHNCNTFLSFFG